MYNTMKIKKMLAVMLLMLAAFSTNVMTAQEMTLPIDPAVRIGKLNNGLTYYIRHNNYPEQRANFYIAQRVGAMQEEDDQNGLAHFLEHMAFNGSEHFNGEGKGIIDYTRSLGVAFGADLNAYTSIAETVYNINDVPSTRQSALDSCLLILKDWSNGLLLTDEEIDKERGVIHEEWRLGLNLLADDAVVGAGLQGALQSDMRSGASHQLHEVPVFFGGVAVACHVADKFAIDLGSRVKAERNLHVFVLEVTIDRLGDTDNLHA